MKLRDSIFYLLKFCGVLCFLRKLKGNDITILCLHRVSDESSPAWKPMKIKTFENLLQYIVKHYNVISLKELNLETTRTKHHAPNLILTFDDGYKDFIVNALPLLKKYKLPAVLNIVVGSIDKSEPIWTQRLNKIIESYCDTETELKFKENSYSIKSDNIDIISTQIFHNLLKKSSDVRNMIINEIEKNSPALIKHTEMLNWEEIKECLNNNIEIGSHTMNHSNLTEIEDKEKLKSEIFKPRDIIREKLNFDAITIAYPNGMYNDKVLSLSEEAGYKYLLLIDEKLYKAEALVTNECQHTINECQLVYKIPRILIQHDSFIENCFKIENFHNLIKTTKVLKTFVVCL